jgi:hypothetical protein
MTIVKVTATAIALVELRNILSSRVIAKGEAGVHRPAAF